MVIVVVLVVIAALSLTAYRYSDSMLTEFQASNSLHGAVQTKHLADSGIHYAAAMLRDVSGNLGGNTWNNPEMFRDVTIETSRGKGKFSLICPSDPEDLDPAAFNYGVIDEGSKINLNAIMKRDPSGALLHHVLVQLPDMTEDIANAIIDWMDFDTDIRAGGAENEYYSSLTPPYRCKNGPIDSIDELLLVKGVTREYLYGSDTNRNGFQDPDDAALDGFARGWSAFLTIHSREQNRDIDGAEPVYLNNVDLQQKIYEVLGPEWEGITGGPELVKFIILYRQYGPMSTTGGTQSLGSTLAALFGGGSSSSSSSKTVEGKLSTYTPKFTRLGRFPIPSIYELVNAQVGIKAVVGKSTTTTIYTSPLKDVTVARELLPKLFERTTLIDDTDPEIPARISINTAPREVLMALVGITALTEGDVDKIIRARPKSSNLEVPPEAFQTAAWLVTEAQLDAKLLNGLDNFVTTRSQVYRVQSVGHYEGKGPAFRVEAVIDVSPGPNGARPRIVAWRDLSELGKGFSDTMP